MGKDLKGKELGIGISQRSDGLYTARFTNRAGKRAQKYFTKLQECRKWLADAQYAEEHENVLFGSVPTVDAWFQYWFSNIKSDNIRYNTKRIYERRYTHDISPVIGKMLLTDVLPLHCQYVLKNMAGKYVDSSLRHCKTIMSMLFDDAVENELITKNPVTKNVKAVSKKMTRDRNAMTIEEQKILLHSTKESVYSNQFVLVLQTGLRVGELIGLKWSDIDFGNKTLTVNRTMMYINKKEGWQIGEPKTSKGKRCIPLTKEAVRVLNNQKEKMQQLRVISFEYKDFVFLNTNGVPITKDAYNSRLRSCCCKESLPLVSMHILRHTFATRCIESGMRPKTLQGILGHSKINITMDLYVHLMEDTKEKELRAIESQLQVV